MFPLIPAPRRSRKARRSGVEPRHQPQCFSFLAEGPGEPATETQSGPREGREFDRHTWTGTSICLYISCGTSGKLFNFFKLQFSLQ